MRKKDITDIYQVRSKGRSDDPSQLETGFRHSSRYHDFFEGYTEAKVETENGKTRIMRVYTAPWIRRDLPEKEQIRLKALYWLLYLAGMALYFWRLVLPIVSNTRPYVAAPGLLSVIFLFLMLFALISYSRAKPLMTIYEYKSSAKRLRKLSLIGGCLMAATALTTLLATWIDHGGAATSINALLLALSSVCVLGIWFKEKQVPYMEVENTNQAPEGGFELR